MTDHHISPPRGASASAIHAQLVNNGVGQDGSYPHDADDFHRCHLYLERSGLYDNLPEMVAVNAYWAALVPAWPDLLAASSDILRTAKIQEIITPIELADPSCARFGNGTMMRVGAATFKGQPNQPATDDELFQRAVMLVWEERKASTSFIQRRLGIGYNQAARLIERMEEMGIVSRANHVGKRDVRSPDDLRAAMNIKDAVDNITEGDEAKTKLLLSVIIASMKEADQAARDKRKAPPMKDDPDFRKHNQDAFNVTAEELRQFIERFEQLELEKQQVADTQKELMAEAKGRGYDTKVMKKIIALRKRKADDIAEEEAVLEMYKQALGMA